MKTNRRAFMQQGALLGAGLCLARASLARAETAGAAKSAAARNPTLDTIHRCRTTHGNFTAQEIPEESLQAILHASVRAPGASNMQSHSIVVVRDRGKMSQVCGDAGSRMLVYCVDSNRLTATAKHLGHTYEPAGVDSLVIGCVNTSLAVQNATVAARSLGIDYLVTNGVHRGDMERVWKLLGLPEKLCFPLVAVVLGNPTVEPEHQRGRLRGPGVVHEDKYHPLTPAELDALVRDHDNPDLQLAMNDEWRGKHAHYLDWYFGEWMARRGPREGETQLTRLLKRAGLA